MSDEPQVERRDGRLWLGWQGDMVPLQYMGAALGEMVLEREAEIERLTRELDDICDQWNDQENRHIAEKRVLYRRVNERQAEIERLARERDAAMAIEYAAREWAAGRMTDDGLREQLEAGGDNE